MAADKLEPPQAKPESHKDRRRGESSMETDAITSSRRSRTSGWVRTGLSARLVCSALVTAMWSRLAWP